MSKLSFIVHRLRHMNYGQMNDTIKELSTKTGKTKLFIFCDMAVCAVRYGAGYVDYRITEMYNLSHAQRKTQITRGKSNKIVKLTEPRELWHCFDNKTEFNTIFAENIKRDWIDFKNTDKETFTEWLKGKDDIIVKPIDGSAGRGVKKYHPDYYIGNDNFYEELKQRGTGIVEECVKQHHIINEINPSSVNTIRIVTLDGDKKKGIVYAYIRIGQNGTDMDNVDCGGMACPIDLDTGIISGPGADKKGHVYDVHPQTGIKLEGLKIPFFDEAKEMCMKATEKIPEMKYVAWDVAITETGPVFIEGNTFPSHAIPQFPAHFKNGIGIMPRFEEFLTL